MSSCWFACPCDAWEIVRPLIPKPWPKEAALADLRHDAIEGKVPGRPALMERWGWTERKTRALLDDAAAWAPPEKWNVQPTSSGRPADVQPQMDEPGVSAENVQPTSSGRPADVQAQPLQKETRARNKKKNKEEQQPDLLATLGDQIAAAVDEGPTVVDLQARRRKAKAVEAAEALLDAYASTARLVGTVLNPAMNRPRHEAGPSPESEAGRALMNALRLHGVDKVSRVLEWVALSPHHQAVWVRSKQLGVAFIVKKLDDYDELREAGPPPREDDPIAQGLALAKQREALRKQGGGG